MSSDRSVSTEALWRQKLRELLQTLPRAYVEQAAAFQVLRHVFYEEMAATAGTALNQYLASIPADRSQGYKQKRDLAVSINHDLHQLGLTVACPKTGQPAHLIVDWAGDDRDNCRFRFETTDPDGRRQRHVTLATLPPLTLVEKPYRESALSRGGTLESLAGRGGGSGDTPGRG